MESSQPAPTQAPTSKDEESFPDASTSTTFTSTAVTQAAASTSPASSSIQITTRTDLSLLYRVLRALIRPIRPHLVRPPKKRVPPGSPRLTPPKKRNIDIREENVEGLWCYRFAAGPHDLSSQVKLEVERAEHTLLPEESETRPETEEGEKGRSERKKHRVYYFHGGGFQSPPSREHWRFLAQLAQDLAGTRHSVTFPGTRREIDHKTQRDGDAKIELVLVSYPLAPASPARESLGILRKWFAHVLDDAGQKGERVSLMGDSSGGNIALSLGFWAVQEYHKSDSRPGEKEENAFPLASLFAISPAVDLCNTNPSIPEYDKLDPVLTMSLTSRVAQVWTGKITSTNEPSPSVYGHEPISPADPSVSPLLNPDHAFHALRDRGVNVHGVVGTHDVLAPDALELMRKCAQSGVRGRWLVWEGQMHCFPLAGGGEMLGIREGQVGRGWAENVLREDAEEGGVM